MKKIGVITVSFNNVAGLERTLASVAAQDYDDFEYIVVDGGSEDGTKELLEENAAKITRWVSEPDKGVYDAMNKAVKMCNAEYLLFINSGDELYSRNTLKKASKKLEGGYDIVYGNLIIDENGKRTKGYMPAEMDLLQMFRDTLWHPVSFIASRLFAEYGGFSLDYRICSDYDFFFRVIAAGRTKLLHISQFIAVFELNGMSSNPDNVPLILSEKERIRKQYLSDSQVNEYLRKAAESVKTKRSFFHKWFQ